VTERPKNTARTTIPAIEPAHAQVIDRHERLLARANESSPPPIKTERATGPLKLPRDVLSYLRQHVIREFFRRAAPGPEETRCRESGVASMEALVVVHAKTYANAICWAAGEFADLLVHALIARSRKSDISKTARTAVWKEALKFADELAGEEVWSSWIENGHFPVSREPEPIWTEQNRQTFLERVRFDRSEWLFEADRRINVRLILGGARPRLKRAEQRRGEIAKLMHASPESSDHDLCLRIDALNEAALSRSSEIPCPVPGFLKRLNLRLWTAAFSGNRPEITQKMHEYLSKIRKQFRLS
jgi:hypothetical protein